MLKLPDKDVSMLLEISDKTDYPALRSDSETEVVIVGGGICGLTCAYLLQKAGKKVAVVEKNRIGSGTSGKTTGKVTSQHNLFYADLQERKNKQIARHYGQANNNAIDEIEKIIKQEKIDCGWERMDHIVYTTDKEKVQQFKKEAKVAASLGLPASYETKTDLPFQTKAAVRFKNQAHFNAKSYVNGLAKAVIKNGGQIYENSPIRHFRDGDIASVATSDATITAQDIIVATNVPSFPLLARGAYCIYEYPTTSYLISTKVKIKIKNMYISPDQDNYSLLPISVKGGKENILLVGGLNHIRGPRSGDKRWQKLADYAQDHFKATEVTYKWSAWDYIAYDDIPLVGQMYPWSNHLYVATAFKKWGLAHSYVAATILRDLITDQSNPLIEIYNPNRFSAVASIPHTFAKMFQ
jgi:glycine/D-amino acid oxidase-like deaminating enzyme